MTKNKQPNNRKNDENKKKRLVAMRREEVAALYLKGYHQQKIADHCNVSVATINLDLKTLQSEWRERAANDIDQRMSEELAKLDKVEATAWQAFEESKETTETSTQGMTVRSTAGDPRFLNIIQNCIDKRCKLLGIDAPSRLELSGKEGQPIEVRERMQMAVSALSDVLKEKKIDLRDSDD